MSRWAVACAVAVALLACGAAAMTTKVEAKTEWCFREDVGKDIPLRFNFKVTAGGKLDIDASVYDGSGRKLHSWHGVTEGHYEVHGDAANTKFRFCFSNKMAHFTPKWVSFFTHKGVHPNVANVEHLDPIEKTIMELNEKISELRDKHDELRVEEKEHRATIEDANERVWLWSGVEGFSLLFMGVLQIFFLKRFLEVRSSV
eukprot:CAMPEP_0174829382 /NCGR_PEP_ID=MMETSP1114-20130205/1899_1 /TAXON_ID=312471 /ORGANISM="Neobodo designis, Strain CCAP 1951/1" /LENGTH=200 /DNA_ID=CAMNT_0016063127 /DNA_START=46 /DNA_END=648 /DNA_ORIENTATION=-